VGEGRRGKGASSVSLLYIKDFCKQIWLWKAFPPAKNWMKSLIWFGVLEKNRKRKNRCFSFFQFDMIIYMYQSDRTSEEETQRGIDVSSRVRFLPQKKYILQMTKTFEEAWLW
jgi:hypothetical protein